jgi:hypothetical protein
MRNGIHFISGLPRSGSTLLAGILRQDFDLALGAPGLHTIRRQVETIERQPVLPPELFRAFENDSLWRWPDANLRHVPIIRLDG